MRKVLLATTALVALGGVSTASADISLSASTSWAYDSWSDDTVATTATSGATTNKTAMTMDGDFTISGSTTADSGMSFGGSVAFDDTTNGDDTRMYISDNWGQISFGEYNDAAKASSVSTSAFDAAISGGSSISTNSTFATKPMMAKGLKTSTVIGGEAKGQIMYTTPTISGITLRVSQTDAGSTSKADTTAVGAVYKASAGGADITLSYAQTSTDVAGDGVGMIESEASTFGVKIAYGDFTARASSSNAERKTKAGVIQSDTNTNEYGVVYAMTDRLTLEAVTMDSGLGKNGVTSGKDGEANAEGAGDTYEATQVGVKYVPAAGMYISLSNRTYEYKNISSKSTDDGALTRLKVGVTF